MQKKIPYPNDPRLGPGVLMIPFGKKKNFRIFDLGPEREKMLGETFVFYGYEVIGPRVYRISRPIYQVGPKPVNHRRRAQEIMRTVRDADCPRCNFPETVIVRKIENVRMKKDGFSFTMGDPIREECSSSKCTWSRKLKSKS